MDCRSCRQAAHVSILKYLTQYAIVTYKMMANVFHVAHKGSLLLSPHFHGPEDSSVIEKV